MKNKPFFLAMLVSLLAFGFPSTSYAQLGNLGRILGEALAKDGAKLVQKGVEKLVSAPDSSAPGLINKLRWLESNAKSGENYTFEVKANENITPISLFYKDKKNITITLKGVGANRIVDLSPSDKSGSMFSVGSGVTLVLDGNIILRSLNNNYEALIKVNSGGVLVMNAGSTITGNLNKGSNGGGVYVSNGGTFTMKGGTISGNTCHLDFDTVQAFRGAGVYVNYKGTFTKTGGTIIGYASDPKNGNVIKSSGKAINNNGHAIYFADSKSIDTTVGPEVSFHFSDGKFSDDKFNKIQKEEPKHEEITAETKQPAPPDVPVVTQTPQDTTPKVYVPVVTQTPQDTIPKYQEAIQKTQQEGSFTDSRDGKTYKIVKIGSQTWFAENLNYEAGGSRCYGNSPANCAKYGRLYNWSLAAKACPSNWHLPSKSEYEVLDKAVGGEYVAGRKLRSKSGWKENGNGTDEFEFSALPSGVGYSDGNFDKVGNLGYWWSSSSDGNHAYYRYMSHYMEYAYWDSYFKSYLFSVRCVKD